MGYCIPLVLEIAAKEISEYKTTTLSNMDTIIYGWAARINRNIAGTNRLKRFLGAAQSIEEPDIDLFTHRKERGAQVTLSPIGQDYYYHTV